MSRTKQELIETLRLKNKEIKALETIIDRIANKISGGRWDLIDKELNKLITFNPADGKPAADL